MTSRTADGVYKSGFAQSQSAYENAVYALFKSLDRIEEILKGKDYLVGNTLTEADIRLFVTTVRSFLNARSEAYCSVSDPL